MADPHTRHRPPAAIELTNATSFVELLSALPPPIAPAPGGVPRPPSAIGDVAAVERLCRDEAVLARMRAALAGVRQVPYMCVDEGERESGVEWREGGRENGEKEQREERNRSSIDGFALALSTHFFLALKKKNSTPTPTTPTAPRSTPRPPSPPPQQPQPPRTKTTAARQGGEAASATSSS